MAAKRHRLAQRRKAVGFSQEQLAERLRVERSTVVRWERGETAPQPWMRPRLAQALRVSVEQLSDLLMDDADAAGLAAAPMQSCTMPLEDRDLAAADAGRRELSEVDDMNRRELLRLMSMAGTLIAVSEIESGLDWERLDYFADGVHRLDPAMVDEYAVLNTHLWRVFALSRTKGAAFPLVREQLDVLVSALQRSCGPAMHRRLCELVSDLFQLAGEILFDGNKYTHAAHCYTLAATAGKEAAAFDLWSCALTRHAFIGVYEQQFAKAAPMLQLAAGLAHKGDDALSTRYWVSAVQAEVFAGLGRLDACQRALDQAGQVHQLNGQIHNGGWLRFDGSRLAEERGTCYVALQRPGLADAALGDALSQNLSARRRGSVLTDLAMLGVQRRDLNQLTTYANAALETARQTGSGVIGRKLQALNRT